MKFLSLAFENFLSYRKRQSIPLADQGLVLVRGENRVSEAVDSNGAGKSALFSALSWVLYGESLPGPDGKVLRADEVACRFTKEPCVVRLDLEVDGKLYWIERKRRPGGVVLGGGVDYPEGADVNVLIRQLVGFGPATFRNAVVFGQGAFERFAQADQAAAMRMLDEIQGLSFKDALDRAKAWRDEWRLREAVLVSEAAQWETQQAVAGRQIEELDQAQASFAADKAARLDQLAGRAKAALEAVRAAETALADVQKDVGVAKKLAAKKRRLEELEAELTTARQALGYTEETRGRLRDRVEQTGQQVEALLQEGKCPTCRQSFEGAVAGKVRRAYRPDLLAVQEELREAEAAVVLAQEGVQRKAAEIERHIKVLPGVTKALLDQAVLDADDRRVIRAVGDLNRAREQDKQAALELQAERKRRWDGQAALDAARKQLADAQEGLTANAQAQEKTRRTIAAADYWVEAFGDRGLRSLLFDSVAGFLNDRVAAHLAVLAAGEAAVDISALTALKGGAVKERLSVGVAWGWGAGTYAAGSAGQDRRVDLALFAALQDLAESRSARKFPLRVYDEPADSLDSRGKEVFIQWVRQEAAKRGTAFLVTHSDELASLGEFDRVWTVVMDRDGSRVEVG